MQREIVCITCGSKYDLEVKKQLHHIVYICKKCKEFESDTNIDNISLKKG